ncbi:MAG: hypothetical protein WCG28_00990 [bacterium]
MDDIVDLLRIKIEKAKRELPLETINAISAVDWKMAILELRTKKGYTFEQIGDLELETELLLCGLTNIEKYQQELENRLKISKVAANELVNEMNNLVFKKIREELVKIIERKKVFTEIKEEKQKENNAILSSAGINIIPDIPLAPYAQLMQAEKLELENRDNLLEKIENPEPVHPIINLENSEVDSTPNMANPILAQKLSGTVQIATVKTEHSLQNLSSSVKESTTTTKNISKIDPYREMPE